MTGDGEMNDVIGDARPTEGGRNLTWWQLILIVLVYLAIIQGLGRVIGAGVDPMSTSRPPATSSRPR